jgi:transcriptional regulator with XRE-family HTH domain
MFSYDKKLAYNIGNTNTRSLTMLALKAQRIARKWSQAKLAREADLNANTVCMVENGRLLPYRSQLVKIARALDVPESEAHRLLEDEPAIEGQTIDRGHRRVGSVT